MRLILLSCHSRDHSLSKFLSPLLRPSQVDDPLIIHSLKSQPSSSRTPVTVSMLGQPPTVVDDPPRAAESRICTAMIADDTLNSDDSITCAVKAVELACGDRLGDEDPISLILEERLDEKDGLLMDGTVSSFHASKMYPHRTSFSANPAPSKRAREGFHDAHSIARSHCACEVDKHLRSR